MVAGLVAGIRDGNEEESEEGGLKMGGCWAGCEFLRSRNPKKGQTASSANHSRHEAEGIKRRRSTQGSSAPERGGRWNPWLT